MSREGLPRVTVIIPTYNWSAVLPFSIGSVLRQSFTDLELLVVGDGCTDGSAEVVGRVADPRVRWINLPSNTGQQSGPNNEGLRQARGELIAYLGHDDLWLPHHLAVLVAALDRGADVAFSIAEYMAEAQGEPRAASVPVGPYRAGMWIPPTALAHRREAVTAIGGWRHFRELKVDPEVDLLQRLAAAGRRFEFVPRLTAVKLPATTRRDVYKIRPHHEQALWFERIGREPDFEAKELARILAASPQPVAHQPIRVMALDLFRAAFSRLGRRLAGGSRLVARYKRGVFDRRRAHKGLPPMP